MRPDIQRWTTGELCPSSYLHAINSCLISISVMVQVKSIAEMGAYVSLLEYNGIEGMILLSELSRRRIRSITKLIKVSCSDLMNRRHSQAEFARSTGWKTRTGHGAACR